MNKDKMETFVRIDGGIGRCYAGTGAVKKHNEKNKISVVTSFPTSFDGIVDRVYPMGTHYLYEDHISKGNYIEPEPYNHYKFYKEKKHICQVFNFLLNGEDKFVQPVIELSPIETEMAKQFIDNIRKGRLQPQKCNCAKCKELESNCDDVKVSKPKTIKKKDKILIFQPYGKTGGTNMPDETFRSFSEKTVSKIVDHFSKEYTILLVRTPNQATIENTISFTVNDVRQIIAAVPYVDGVICCDSFLNHGVAAIGSPVKTIVLWGGTDERQFGYKEHINLRVKEIEAEPNRVPHNHSYYVKKNKGCNDFESLVPEVKAIFKEYEEEKAEKKEAEKKKEEAEKKEKEQKKKETDRKKKIKKRIRKKSKREKKKGRKIKHKKLKKRRK